ncbi:hypothetical protein HYALB_00004289 [Hymenoscyphus albidus]|uniref:Uncharacterized protein n=1 Tax=Hymenoscyphus albidus TaxID=595503 RepID=A0A9N9LK63_9HELO|nr:hypothetical protein HYALB_00004289 [Hymenoscyphus albidus]
MVVVVVLVAAPRRVVVCDETSICINDRKNPHTPLFEASIHGTFENTLRVAASGDQMAYLRTKK